MAIQWVALLRRYFTVAEGLGAGSLQLKTLRLLIPVIRSNRRSFWDFGIELGRLWLGSRGGPHPS